jgi:hypothetical protein
MRYAKLLPLTAALLLVACQSATDPAPPPASSQSVAHLESGRLVVRVYWGDEGIPDKRVDVVELHLTATTDDAGYAEFTLPAGAYTLRAYAINRGGPVLRSIDTPVTVKAGEDARVGVFDCLPCV